MSDFRVLQRLGYEGLQPQERRCLSCTQKSWIGYILVATALACLLTTVGILLFWRWEHQRPVEGPFVAVAGLFAQESGNRTGNNLSNWGAKCPWGRIHRNLQRDRRLFFLLHHGLSCPLPPSMFLLRSSLHASPCSCRPSFALALALG